LIHSKLKYMKKLKNTRSIIVLSVLSALFLTSCKSSNDDEDMQSENGNNYKITVTLTNVNASDDYVFVGAVGTGAGSKLDVWKVNNVVKVGESSVSLGDTDFTGSTKTYVIETTEKISNFSNNVQIINYGQDMTISYKIEKDNAVKINENMTLTGAGANFTKDYSF